MVLPSNDKRLTPATAHHLTGSFAVAGASALDRKRFNMADLAKLKKQNAKLEKEVIAARVTLNDAIESHARAFAEAAVAREEIEKLELLEQAMALRAAGKSA